MKLAGDGWEDARKATGSASKHSKHPCQVGDVTPANLIDELASYFMHFHLTIIDHSRVV